MSVHGPSPYPGETPFWLAKDENLGSIKPLSVGKTDVALAFNAKENRVSRLLTLSLSWTYDAQAPVLATDDLSGFFWIVTYGVGGTDERVEIDPCIGLFVSIPTVTWSVFGSYGKPTPTVANPTPTTPDIWMRTMIATGTRPAAPMSPTRTRRFALDNGGDSTLQQVPRLARSLHMLGTQTTYAVTFFSSTLGAPSKILTVAVGSTLASLISVPIGAQSFSVHSAGGAEEVVMAVFQLAL
ncbi:MAG: hypothetical protein ACHREM_15080 [Polyangiales bacterium]